MYRDETDRSGQRQDGEAESTGSGVDIAGAHQPRQDVPAAVTESVEAAAVDHLFGQVDIAVAVNVLLATFVVVALWGYVAPVVLLPWLAGVIATNGLRLLLLRAYGRSPQAGPHTWSRRYLAGLAASSVFWGVATPLFVPLVPPLQALVLVTSIAGLSAGGLPLNAVVLRTYVVFVVTVLTPAAVTFFAMGAYPGGDPQAHLLLGVMTVLFGTALVLAARGYNRSLRHAYELSARLNDANRELERRASHDTLTGLWNRDRFEIALDQELDRVARYGSPSALLMIDIDHFKPVNDNYGHDTGDRVLGQFGELLIAQLRSPDQGARWGGEEFMILLPETGVRAARETAERLRREVAEARFDGPGRLTISVGVACCDAEEVRSALLKRLDDALYRAKQTGRNRVEVADEPRTGHA